jgi:hypothetical protein
VVESRDVTSYLVEQLLNFSKVRRAEISGIDADYLSAKAGKFGRIGRRWECKRHSLDGHLSTIDSPEPDRMQ